MTESMPAATTNTVVVSCDAHVGPLLDDQLRDYCPKKHLGDFDDFVTRYRAQQASLLAGFGGAETASRINSHPNLQTAGHHDVHARIRDMDRDGVAAEVIYHFSTNGEPFPFVLNFAGGLANDPVDFELGAVGYKLYNRWLADFCSVEPERHIGLAYLPTWDIEAATREVEWAREAGLGAVNFPPPGRPGHLPYNHPDWEPFWAACASLGLSLNTHSSGAQPIDYNSGPGGTDLLIYEGGGWLSRRAVWWLIHGQVFERHPDLKLVITEQYEGWWLPTRRELDSVYDSFGVSFGRQSLPKRPSEYMDDNVFLGASFMSTYQAEEACREGYAANVLWGRDYPHAEGTWLYAEDLDDEPVTRLSLRHVLSRVPAREARMMAGENAIRAYGLDATKLAEVATRIGALTPEELATPPGSLPEVPANCNAFRGQAGLRPEPAAAPA